MISTEKSFDHKYRLRSCTNCLRFDECFAKHDPRMVWADCAKYGCRRYLSDNEQFMNEQPKKRTKISKL